MNWLANNPSSPNRGLHDFLAMSGPRNPAVQTDAMRSSLLDDSLSRFCTKQVSRFTMPRLDGSGCGAGAVQLRADRCQRYDRKRETSLATTSARNLQQIFN